MFFLDPKSYRVFDKISPFILSSRAHRAPILVSCQILIFGVVLSKFKKQAAHFYAFHSWGRLVPFRKYA
jgi:hypothetical protein